MVLPPGTCKATNPAYAASQEQWARWCEKNCVGDKWSSTMASTTDGLKGCVDGSETGEVMCVCTQGVDPIAPGSDAQPAAQAAADSKAAAPSKPKAKPEATTPKAKPKPKPNAKPNAKPNGKKPSAKQQQQQAAAASGKAKGKGCTCSDVYACCDAAEGACTSPTDKSRPYSFCGGTAKSAPACSVSSANCSNSEFSASDKDAYDVRCRDKTFRDSKLGTDSECAEQGEEEVRTQEDEARGTDELDEGYLTRGGADEANWPAPQQAQQQQAVAAAPDNRGISSSGIIGADGDVPESFVTENAPPFPPEPPPGSRRRGRTPRRRRPSRPRR